MRSNRFLSHRGGSYAQLLMPALAVLMIGVVGCNRSSHPAPSSSSSAESETPRISVVHPERQGIRRTVSQPGYVQAYEQTPVFSKIPGYVEKINVDKGDLVSKGKVLAVLRVPELEAAVAQMTALIGQADAELKQSTEKVAVAWADFKSAEAKAQAAAAARGRAEALVQRTQSQLKKFTKAGREGAIGGEDVEETMLAAKAAEAGLAEVNAQVRAAEADRDASRAKWHKAQVDVRVAEAGLEVARKNYDQAKTMWDYREIVAPFDSGVVTQRNVDTGHFVQPATGPRGEALFVVMRTDLMRIQVEVPETDADWVSKDTAVRIRIPVLRAYEFVGKVSRTSWSVDRTARTLLAEVDVPDSSGKLRPGMYAYATISAERPNVLTLPASAVQTEGDVTTGYRTSCFLLMDGKAVRTVIEIGARDKERVEVLKKQTRAGKTLGEGVWEEITGKEEVIQAIPSGLVDGQAVQTVAPKP
jgi:multidrug efflux pump subunit AcrA (membrane-fusion protein)